MDDIRVPVAAGSTRFIDQVRRNMRDKGYAWQTEKTYVHWIVRYIRFHHMRHPGRMGAAGASAFLGALAHDRQCLRAIRHIALNALMYCYRKFLQVELEPLAFETSRVPRRLPMMLVCGAMGVISPVDA